MNGPGADELVDVTETSTSWKAGLLHLTGDYGTQALGASCAF